MMLTYDHNVTFKRYTFEGDQGTMDFGRAGEWLFFLLRDVPMEKTNRLLNRLAKLGCMHFLWNVAGQSLATNICAVDGTTQKGKK